MIKMRRKTLNIIACTLLLFICFSSCQKNVDYSKDLADLRAAVNTLQKSSDSLKNALQLSNTIQSNQSKSIDSIKTELSNIVLQINKLSSFLSTQVNNIETIQAEIAALNIQYADLLLRLNNLLNLFYSVPSTISTGLVAWYPFTGNSIDSSGNANHGTITGAKLTTDRFGDANKAYLFNGTSDYIRVNNSSSLNSGSVSISGWFNPNSLSTNANNGCKTIISKWWQANSVCNGNYNAFNVLLTSPISTCKLGTASAFYDGNVFYAPNSIATNTWYHFVFIHNANSGGAVYINGALVNSNSITGSLCNSTNPLYIGVDNNNGTLWRYFDGKIDDLRVYNRPLTQLEINYLATH